MRYAKNLFAYLIFYKISGNKVEEIWHYIHTVTFFFVYLCSEALKLKKKKNLSGRQYRIIPKSKDSGVNAGIKS